MTAKKTAIVTGASQGIGAGLVDAFLNEGYNVVANARHASLLVSSPSFIFVEGDISKHETAINIVEHAINDFGGIDVLINNAGIFQTKSFIDYTIEDFNALVSTNLFGFVNVTQLSVKQMLKQKSGCVVTLTASLADQPIAGTNASVAMMTKGGLNSITRSLAIEYAHEHIRFNAVAPGIVATPMHANDTYLNERLPPLGKIADVQDIVDAVLYLVKAEQVTGEVLYVDGGLHAGR